MRTKLAALLLAGGVLTGSASVVAHHAFAAEFDRNKPVEFSGTVTKIEWINPHAWLYWPPPLRRLVRHRRSRRQIAARRAVLVRGGHASRRVRGSRSIALA
jgi:hypothetical protein